MGLTPLCERGLGVAAAYDQNYRIPARAGVARARWPLGSYPGATHPTNASHRARSALNEEINLMAKKSAPPAAYAGAEPNPPPKNQKGKKGVMPAFLTKGKAAAGSRLPKARNPR
jgi:hypothetical protein